MQTICSLFFAVIKVFSAYFALLGLCTLLRRRPATGPVALSRFAVLVAARNEASCIVGLIESLKKQNYPPDLVDIWVLPNNCTDDTAGVARQAGARVMDMPAHVQSKGAALNCAADRLLRSGRAYDAFCVFDADNEADPSFLAEMNRALAGARIAKSRILAKNPFQSGIAGCYEIYFCTANRFLNRAREQLGLSARVIGTGFAIRRDYLQELGGFPCRTMTEDAELYAACLTRGERIAYCEKAITYDEEPLTLKESLIQRRRWMSGIADVARLTLTTQLSAFACRPSLSGLDGMLQFIYPTLQAFTPIFLALALLGGSLTLPGLLLSLPLAYLGALGMALPALLLEGRLSPRLWKGLLLYPLFMATFLPLQLLALVKKQTVWKEIRHTGVRLQALNDSHSA
ncbi:MAG: glycosyltransferase [Oscillospiraceae bacterium]|nr:glycosyltransferase [Oscillospiraceae bacterium]